MLGLQQLCDKLMNDALTDLTILGITISPTSQYYVLKTRLAGLAERDDHEALQTGIALLMAIERLKPLVHHVHL